MKDLLIFLNMQCSRMRSALDWSASSDILEVQTDPILPPPAPVLKLVALHATHAQLEIYLPQTALEGKASHCRVLAQSTVTVSTFQRIVEGFGKEWENLNCRPMSRSGYHLGKRSLIRWSFCNQAHSIKYASRCIMLRFGGPAAVLSL